MSQNKEGTEGSEKKPGVKIQDLSPKKDAKGGGGVRILDGGGFAASGGGRDQSGGGTNPSGGGASPSGNPNQD